MNKIRVAGAAAGVVLVSGMVLQVSSAAFQGELKNEGNDWTAGTVYLSDGDTVGAMYEAEADVVPGYDEVRCIEVTYDGTVLPSEPIQLGATIIESAADIDTDDSDGLANDLTLDVALGTSCGALTTLVNSVLPAGTAVYSGKLDAFSSRTTQWTPAAEGETRAFRFRVRLADDETTPNHAQGDTAIADFVWTSTS